MLLLLLLMMLVVRLLRGSVEGGREQGFVVLERSEGSKGDSSCSFGEEVHGKRDRRKRQRRGRSRELKRRVTDTGRRRRRR